MLTELILLSLGSYLVGSIPLAYILARWRRGIDLREHGSGNVGASNVMATTSKWLGIAVFIFDAGKGALMVFAARMLGLGLVGELIAGGMAIVGHNWPVFLGFRGGRGIATTLGVVTMISPLLGLIVMVIAYSLAPLKQLPLGVFIASIALPLMSLFLGPSLGITNATTAAIGFGGIVAVIILRRLLVPRTALSEGLPGRIVYINRLLFDRDIKDRERWLRGRP